MSSHSDSSQDSEQDIAQDARDLRRGVTINLLGYLLKAAHPLLLVFVVRMYGAEAFGVFTLVQAINMLAMRGVLVGFDKAVLWWVPRQAVGQEKHGLLPMLLAPTALAAVVSIAIFGFGKPLMEAWNGQSAATAAQLMILGLAPMALTELLIAATLGRKQMTARVVVRETLVPLVQVGGGLGLFALGFAQWGLAAAYVMSHMLGLVVAWVFFRRAFKNSGSWGPLWPPPVPATRYALPMWLTELVGSMSMRLDVYLLATLSDAATVGIYAAVTQVGNTLRQIRQSFDPIVIALFSQISSRADTARLRAGFSRATVMVLVTQAPVYAFLFAFAKWLMPLFGAGFERGVDAVLVFAFGGLVNGLLGLHGLLLFGYGRSDLILLDLIISMAVQASLLFALVPTFGVTGAALSVAASLTIVNTLQVWQGKRLCGANLYNRSVVRALGGAAASALTMGLAWLALSPLGEQMQRVGSFAAFLITGGVILMALRGHRDPT